MVERGSACKGGHVVKDRAPCCEAMGDDVGGKETTQQLVLNEMWKELLLACGLALSAGKDRAQHFPFPSAGGKTGQ